MFRQQLFPLELKLTFAGIQCRINLLAWSLLETGSLTGNLTCQGFHCISLYTYNWPFPSQSESLCETIHMKMWWKVFLKYERFCMRTRFEIEAKGKLWNALLSGNDGMIVCSVTKLSPPLLCCPTISSGVCGSVKNTCKLPQVRQRLVIKEVLKGQGKVREFYFESAKIDTEEKSGKLKYLKCPYDQILDIHFFMFS